jgi:hypothetical protein
MNGIGASGGVQNCQFFPDSICHELKGTVSPDTGLQFSFWKIKLVLSAKPLMVLTFFYFVVHEILKNRYLHCFYENTY